MFTRSTTIRLCAGAGLTVVAASAGLAQSSTTVFGPTAEQHFTQRVSVADLNLANAPDRRILFHRVNVASRQVCAPPAYDPLLSVNEQYGCIDQALLDARPQIDLAITRATQIAELGSSSIPAMGIAVSSRL